MTLQKRSPLDFGADPALVSEPPAQAPAPTPNTVPAAHAYWWALLAALLWGVALLALVLTAEASGGPLTSPSVRLALLASLALAPLGVAFFAAYVVRQGAALAAETRRTRALAQGLVDPALLASAETGRVTAEITTQLEGLRAAAAEARDQLSAVRAELAAESDRLAAQAVDAGAAAERARDTLAGERARLEALTGELEGRALAVAEAVNSTARMIATAAVMAQTQMVEAQKELATRTTRLDEAAAKAGEASRAAADDLARQALRLEGAGAAVGEHMAQVEAALNGRRADLVAAAEAWREQQEQLAAEAESRQARLADSLERAGAAGRDLEIKTAGAAEALRGVLSTAGEHLDALSSTAESRRAELDAAIEAALDRLALSIAEHRRALETEASEAAVRFAALAQESLRSTDVQADAARAKLDALHAHAAEADRSIEETFKARIEGARRLHDMLAESAFAAARQADATFEARLNTARKLVEQSALLLDEASEKTTARIEAGLSAATLSLSGLQAGFDAVDRRLERLPTETDARVREVEAAVERGAAELVAVARRAAEETQAIDAAFQERVRRNYQMLSEAVRLMGAVAGGQPPSSSLSLMQPAPAEAAEPPSPVEAPRPAPEPEASSSAPSAPKRRSRLRLTSAPTPEPAGAPPAAAPAEFHDIFAAAGGPSEALTALAEPPPTAEAARSDEGWTWKELLTAMDEAPLDDEALVERLLAEIEAMGVDAPALLPRARIDEIAAAWQTGDGHGARLVVSRLAPAAVRRLSRRIATDRALAAQVERFVQRFEGVLAEARRSDREGLATAALLGSDPGRAYLLLEAAAAEAEGV
jgi:hypothetical protein